MDVALWFFLPLIGGYSFSVNFLLLRYRTGREDGQRLYFRAALIGVYLATVTGLLHWIALALFPDYRAVLDTLGKQVIGPLIEKETGASSAANLSAAAVAARTQLAIVCLLALIVGVAAPLWNALLLRLDALWVAAAGPAYSLLRAYNRRAIDDRLEALLAESLEDASLIQVTLINHKVYVGTVLQTTDPATPAKYFKIQPWISGFRSPDDGTVSYTTFYDEALDGKDERGMPLSAKSFELVIAIDKVITAGGFDFTAYGFFEDKRAAVEAVTTAPQTLTQVSGELAVRLLPRARASTASDQA